VATTRMSTETRRQQIVQAALEAIGEYGIQGATITRIAQGAGITPAALYSHFENRRAILIAALEKVYEQIVESFGQASNDEPVVRVGRIFERHAEKVTSQDKTSHAHLFLEFVASAPEEGLREVLREKELETGSRLASLVRSYQERGRLSADIDADAIAWLIAAWAWSGDVANLMDVAPAWSEKVSPLLVQLILGRIARDGTETLDAPDPTDPTASASERADQDAIASEPNETEHDGLPEGAVFTMKETADILKVETETISDMVRQKHIPSLQLGDQTRIPRRALVALLRRSSD
jgi:excisionase family DNA binding protein